MMKLDMRTRGIRKPGDGRLHASDASAFFVLLLALIIAVTWFGSLSGSGTAGYRRFANRDQDYFAKLAMACDSVLRTTRRYHLEVRLIATNNELPQIIRQFGPNALVAFGKEIPFENDTGWTSYVTVHVGSGPSSYVVVWSNRGADGSHSKWVLSVNQESLSRQLFETNVLQQRERAPK